MMKKALFLICTFLILSNTSFSQSDPKAAALLDRFSSKATAAPSVSMKFIIVSTDLAENSRDTLSGSIILSKDNYKLDLPGNIVWYNGETSWSYLPAEKEVTITKPDRKDDSFLSRPSSVFSMYKKDYKSRLIEEKSDAYIVDLYPENIKNEIIRIRLTIAKPSNNLKSLEYKRRDGITNTLIVSDYNLSLVPEPGFFIFNKEKYKDVDVIDMR